MDRRLQLGNVISYALHIAILFLVDGTTSNPNPTGEYNFMQLRLQWPPAICSSGLLLVEKYHLCDWPILREFKIREYVPMYYKINEINQEEQPVLPYNKSGCSMIPAVPEYFVMGMLNRETKDNMITYWPDVVNYQNGTLNQKYWMSLWKTHGMCSEFPQTPYRYFKKAIDIIKQTNFLLYLGRDGISPNDTEKYSLEAIRNSIQRSIRKYTQIRCNRDKENVLQLSEIWLCFRKNGNLFSCPTWYSGCETVLASDDEGVRFPAP